MDSISDNVQSLVEEKICCTCKELRPLVEFCRNKSAKDGLSAQCRKCAKEYRDSHKEEKKSYPSSSLEYRREYLRNNVEHINELRRGKYQVMIEENPEKVSRLREISRIYYATHPIESKIYRSNYWEEHKDHLKEENKKWRAINVDSILLRNRARQKTLDAAIITQDEINELLIRHDNKCLYCKAFVKRGVNLHLDHMIPLSRGGAHAIDNIAPACAPCNLKKGTKTMEEFMEYLGIVKESNAH